MSSERLGTKLFNLAKKAHEAFGYLPQAGVAAMMAALGWFLSFSPMFITFVALSAAVLSLLIFKLCSSHKVAFTIHGLIILIVVIVTWQQYDNYKITYLGMSAGFVPKDPTYVSATSSNIDVAFFQSK